MNPLHTQGDWVCIDGNIFSDGFTTKTPVARVYKRKSPHVTLANARLIAAAPDLLAALLALSQHFPGKWVNDPRTQAEIDDHLALANRMAAAAIAKATREAL